jgi:hypothetical protein
MVEVFAHPQRKPDAGAMPYLAHAGVATMPRASTRRRLFVWEDDGVGMKVVGTMVGAAGNYTFSAVVHQADGGRSVTHRVSRYRDADMPLRWMATAFLEAEKSFRRIHGHRDLWVLATALGRSTADVDGKARTS